MRQVGLAILLLSSCTRSNINQVVACTPGEQRACACIGGSTGVQICNPQGNALGECLGCPGGPQLDLAGTEGHDLAGADFSFPPGTDLTGFNPQPDLKGVDLAGLDFAGVDMAVPEEDMAVTIGDMAKPVDLRAADLRPVDPCPVVMLVLDTSGSMDTQFPSLSTTHIAAARTALTKVVDNYGSRFPFGFAHYDAPTFTCSDGVVTMVEPAAGTAAAVKSAISSMVPGGSTNTTNAINAIAADPNMHDAIRPGSFIVLVTDGAANCENTDPAAAVTAIDNAAKGVQPVKTYVVALDVALMLSGDEAEMESMAKAGQRQCSGGFCEKHAYWPAAQPTQLEKALDLVLNDIVAKSPGGKCGGFGCFPSGASCGAGQTCCGTVGCKTLQNDPQNCGQCGTVCGSGGTCAGGTCSCNGLQCPAGDTCCQGTCCSKLDMALPSALPQCVCATPCLLGCHATNCCEENGSCVGTPNLCTCVPSGIGGCT